MPVAFENIIKASHLVVTKNIKNVVGPQMLVQSSIFGRLGECHLQLFTPHHSVDYTVYSRGNASLMVILRVAP